jgi:hypothetical protein
MTTCHRDFPVAARRRCYRGGYQPTQEQTAARRPVLKSKPPKNNKPKNPYARAKWLALVAMAGLAILLNIVLRDWVASLHLAVVIVFTVITVVLAVHNLVIAVAKRLGRNGEDPGGSGDGPGGSGGPDDPGPAPADPECADPLGRQDDFGLAA